MRFLLGDNHVVFGDMLRHFMKGRLQIADMRCVASHDDLITAAGTTEYDLIAFNLHMPGASIPGTIEALTTSQPGTPVAVFADAGAMAHAMACVKAGALGFIPKTMSAEEVLDALRKVASGDEYLPDFLFDDAHGGSRPTRREIAAIYGRQLTKREFTVLQELCDGKSNKEIGRDLGIAEQTVKIHLQRIFKKMGAKNRADAVRIALHLPATA